MGELRIDWDNNLRDHERKPTILVLTFYYKSRKSLMHNSKKALVQFTLVFISRNNQAKGCVSKVIKLKIKAVDNST